MELKYTLTSGFSVNIIKAVTKCEWLLPFAFVVLRNMNRFVHIGRDLKK